MSISKDKINQYLLLILKRIGYTIIFPLLPVLTRLIVSTFANKAIPQLDSNDLLYYSFTICVLLLDRLRSKVDTIFIYITRFILYVICLFAILLIVLVLTGTDGSLVPTFSIITAVFCFVCGSLSEINESKHGKEKE